MTLQHITSINPFPKNGRLGITINGIDIAVFKVGQVYHAIERYCPHAGGDLLEGTIDKGIVECPVHGATFDLATGKFVQTEYVSPHLASAMHDTRSFPIVIKDGSLYVDVP